MTIKWIVPGPNAKVLAQAIHCLAKLGDDLYIDGRSNKLSLRTVNMAKTAFASFSFFPDFFSYYPVIQSDDGECCEVSMKAVLCVLRVPATMDKCVESCAITCSDDLVQLIIKYKLGFLKTNSIQLTHSDTLHARYENESLPSCVVMDPKLLIDRLSSFNSHEITWAVTKDGVQFRNFSDLVEDTGGLRSEVRVDREELLELVVCESEGAELTFCLAELKTIINFAEHICAPIKCSFSSTGNPIYFIVANQVVLAHVVLSTLGLSNTQSTCSQPARPVAEQSQRNYFTQSQPKQNDISLSQQIPNHFSQPQLIDMPQQMEMDKPEQVPGESTQRCMSVLRHVLHREHHAPNMPGYDDILAPDSDDDN